MPPALDSLFGWIPPEHRTPEMEEAHDRAVRSMPRFTIRGRTVYGNKTLLFDWSKEANGGKHLQCFTQMSGSCVGNGLGMALWNLAGVQRVKLGDAISMVMPFWPLTYGKARELGGARSKGSGAMGANAAAAARDFGIPPLDTPGLPKTSVVEGGLTFGKAVELQYSTLSGIDQKFIDAARPHLCRTVAPVLTADDVRDALVNGHPVTIASDWGTQTRKLPVVSGVLLASHSSRWMHQMCVLGWWEHEILGEIFWVQNSWGTKIFGQCPSGAPAGGFWVKKADMDYIVRQRDSFAFSSFVGFPAQDMDLDFYVREDSNETEDRQGSAGRLRDRRRGRYAPLA